MMTIDAIIEQVYEQVGDDSEGWIETDPVRRMLEEAFEYVLGDGYHLRPHVSYPNGKRTETRFSDESRQRLLKEQRARLDEVLGKEPVA